jgi:hypothetical protein
MHRMVEKTHGAGENFSRISTGKSRRSPEGYGALHRIGCRKLVVTACIAVG